MVSKKILIIVAHPDDAELLAGGLAIKHSQRGNQVQILSITNGNTGHQTIKPDDLAKIRLKEGKAASKILNASFSCLGVDDGEIYINSELTKKLVHKIRAYNPDLIITHRPNDYHRDHRYTGQLVIDVSYMLIVPHYAPQVPPKSRKMPVIVYGMDAFVRPYPFMPEVVLNIDDVMDTKIQALTAHKSQFFEWLPWTLRLENFIPRDNRKKQLSMLKKFISEYYKEIKDRISKSVFDNPSQVPEDFEAFEISEYGHQPSLKQLKELFPDADFIAKDKLKSYLKKII